MTLIQKKTKVIEGLRPDEVPYQELLEASKPVVLKGLVKDWELVATGSRSAVEALSYLKSFYNGKTVGAFLGGPEINGRFFYNDDLTGLNFTTERLPLDLLLDRIRDHLGDANPPALYSGSMTLDACLPGLRKANDLAFDHEMFANSQPLVSIWLGNQSLVSAHYDAPNNLACCAVGRRRFTLFPPEQVVNLYPGPLDPTPGGQAISMVDFNNPDFEKFPRFRDAVVAGEVADLEPGDALFYPSLWWHQVEAFDPFNAMINYWWNTSPAYMGTPMNALYHALLALRDRPEQEKGGWKDLFDYYVFGSPERPRQHLPEHAQGDLGPLDDMKARRLRAMLINKLNR